MTDKNILQAILDKITALEQVVSKGFKDVSDRFDRTDERIDKLGMQIAALEDDSPKKEEFENLEDKVKKIEKQVASV